MLSEQLIFDLENIIEIGFAPTTDPKMQKRLKQNVFGKLTQPQKNFLARRSRELGASRKKTLSLYGSAGTPLKGEKDMAGGTYKSKFKPEPSERI